MRSLTSQEIWGRCMAGKGIYSRSSVPLCLNFNVSITELRSGENSQLLDLARYSPRTPSTCSLIWKLITHRLFH
ncbi:unnamed protein product [Haemonchus placei]|uniref:Uncharacterized protein n=1 Tax=Haemonchus placei TaxID=6290 RepID=A0A3P7TFC0_HAEPC|nr:unnamed protein product [Haemonchus placei]